MDLRDLVHRYAWDPLHIDKLVNALGLVPGGAPQHRCEPPAVVVAIVDRARPEDLLRSRGWLAGAQHVVLLVIPGADPDLVAIEGEDWREALGDLHASVVPWRDDASCGEALDRALALARTASTRRTSAGARGDVGHGGPDAQVAVRELASTGWYEHGVHYARLVDLANDLVTKLTQTAQGGAYDVDMDELIAIAVAERAALELERRQRPANRREHLRHPGWTPLGRDPIHPIAWRGDRMAFYWSLIAPAGPTFLSATDHDWPCGPAKKLYGFADNDPLQIVLAPDASTYAARFDHDVTISHAVPIAWTPMGEVDVALFRRDPRRATFFAMTGGDLPRPDDQDPLDEDARDEPPGFTLAPDGHYALDLGYRVYRIARPALDADAIAVLAGGPDEGYAVFDADHRRVRDGDGRLIGGWFRWTTIEHDGAYWREDLATGERTRIAPIDPFRCDDPDVEAIARDANRQGRHDEALEIRRSQGARAVFTEEQALAIPGTRNVLLVGSRHIRVI